MFRILVTQGHGRLVLLLLQGLAMGVLLGAAGGCEVKPSVREIQPGIELPEGTWIEIQAEPPLTVSHQIQRISIDVPEIAQWGLGDGGDRFVMPSGEDFDLEVELIADDGSRFIMNSLGLGPGLMFSHLPEDPVGASRLPPEREFVIVRLRSSRAISGGPVSWICITNY